MSRVCYKLVGIRPGQIIEHQRRQPGAPSEGVMIEWAKTRGCHFVGRYYPKLKGWRVLKIDNAIKVSFGMSGKQGWKNYGRGRRVYPTEHAMAMHVMALCGVRPDVT